MEQLLVCPIGRNTRWHSGAVGSRRSRGGSGGILLCGSLFAVPPAAAQRLEESGRVGIAIGDGLSLLHSGAPVIPLCLEQSELAHAAGFVACGGDVEVGAG